MNFPSKIVEELVEHFAQLPGIGRKTALRLVLHQLKQPATQVKDFGRSLQELHSKVVHCRSCHNISDFELCEICSNSHRRKDVVCVVEDVRDVLAIENTQAFSGKYHVLNGVISPMEGIGPGDLTIESLIQKVEAEGVEEVILALPATMEGDTTAFFIFRRLSDLSCKVSTIARGISIGDELQYADEVSLGRSIADRLPFENTLKK